EGNVTRRQVARRPRVSETVRVYQRPSHCGATIMKRQLLLIVLLIGVAGCDDTVDSIAREYRRPNNELIDALSQVTSEASAKDYRDRVLEPRVGRYQSIDGRLNVVRANRTKKEFGEE